MQSLKKQLRKLYAFKLIGNLSIAGAAWVLILVSQGFTTFEVGLFETVFHIVSLTAEIPSGMFADIFGRKKSLLMSCVCSILSSVIRILFVSFPGVCASIAFSALSYNFVSGSDSALAYDTLLEHGKKDMYDKYISNQTVIYRVAYGAATLAAGLAVMLGNTKAQMISIGISLVQMLIVCTLVENKVIRDNKKTLGERVKECYRESFLFLKGNRKVAGLIFRKALVGAVDVLLLFFLQARLPLTGIKEWVLGPLLFVMSMGGVAGAFLSVKVKHWPIMRVFIFSLTLVTVGFAANFTGVAWIMTTGGFLTAFADDLIQIRSDVELNSMVPPAQRATLISVSSWCFSVVMIFLSPLSGIIFSL